MKKGDSATNIVMWLGVVLSVIIVALWFVGLLRPLQLESDSTNHDLNEFYSSANMACNSLAYEKRYNPVTEEGNLTLNASHICITTTIMKCRETPCDIEEATFLLEDISTLIIQKKDTVLIREDDGGEMI